MRKLYETSTKNQSLSSFTYSSKKLIFVFILLLILPLTGCKSVVKETDVEKPNVRIVSPNGDVYVGEWVCMGNHMVKEHELLRQWEQV